MTFATYTNGIPAATHNPSNDQGPMQINTNSISSLIGIDHFGFNNNLGGYHQQVHLVNQSAPGIGTASGVLYATLFNGNSWPIWQNALGSTSIITGPTTAAANGQVFLAGGIIIQWGFNAAAASGTPISFSPAFPNNAFFISITVANNSTAHRTYVSTNGLSKTAFTPILLSTNGNPESDDIFWMAIGN